jgi:hypothetical protein
MSDTLASVVVNNTIVSNDSTGIAGSLFSTQVGSANTGPTTGVPSPAGISSELTSAPLLAALNKNQRAANKVSDPHLVNNIVWRNRSFFFTIVGGTSQLSPSNNWNDAVAATKPAPLGTPGTDGCVPSQEKYWDLGVVGDTSSTLTPGFAVGNTVLSTTAGNPNLLKVYCNASRAIPGLQFEPGTPFQPPFNLAVAATLDESGNFVDLHFGPLSVMDQATGKSVNGDYHLAGTSGIAYNTGSSNGAPNHDIDGDARPQAGIYDKGADEYVAPAIAIGSVTGGPLNFGSVAVGATSASQTLTLHNTGTASLTGISVAPSVAQFARSGGTCSTTLAANAICTITVTFTPSAPGSVTGTLATSANVAITGVPVSLSGTGVAAVTSATFTPTSWSPSMTRTCPGTTLAQIAACALGPVQVFTLTNTGNVPLAGITKGFLGGTSTADYTVSNLLSTCGPTGGGQTVGNTTLAPGATCVVTVQFKARTSDPANSVRTATIGVTDGAGTQTSTLSGTAK